MQPITNEDIRNDIEGFKTRIKRARAKLVELQPNETYKNKLKMKQLQQEIEHCQKLIEMAEGALERPIWD